MDWSPAEIAEAQALYDRGLTPTHVAEHFRRFGRAPGMTSAEIARVINTHRTVVPPSGALRAEIRRVRETEWVTYPVIAKRLGVSVYLVERTCVGMRPPEGVKVISARGTETVQGQRDDSVNDRLIRFRQPETVEVPAWVPEHLHELYEHVAAQQDEFAAARVIRELKRGNSVAASTLPRSGASDLDPSELFGEPRSRIHPLPATGREEGRHLHSEGSL